MCRTYKPIGKGQPIRHLGGWQRRQNGRNTRPDSFTLLVVFAPDKDKRLAGVLSSSREIRVETTSFSTEARFFCTPSRSPPQRCEFFVVPLVNTREEVFLELCTLCV